MNIPFIEENDQTIARKQHLAEIQQLIGNVYPNKFDRSRIAAEEDTISNLLNFEPVAAIDKEIKEHIATLSEGEKPAPELKDRLNAKLKEFGNVRVSGRIATPPRVMGKAAFVHLSDGVNRLQIYVRKQDVKAVSNDNYQAIEDETSGWQLMNLLDHGDFVGVEGFLFVTNTGELSVHVETLQFLSKAMLPMPDKIHGIADPELQRRYRYADLIADSLKIEHDAMTTREVFERRAKLISGMRNYLDAHGYIEVETPMLTPKATGAAAKPFKTKHNALDIDLYARIAPELYLKRLVVGGFEKVYELNRNFRNEGIDSTHNPEFTMLEFYCAYMDVNGMMDFAEAMIKESVQKANNRGLQVKYGENAIDFSQFDRLSMKQAIVNYWDDDLRQLGNDEFKFEWLHNQSLLKSLYIFGDFIDYEVHKASMVNPSVSEESMLQKRDLIKKQVVSSKKNECWEKAKQFGNLDLSNINPENFEIEQIVLETVVNNLNSCRTEESIESMIVNYLFEKNIEYKLIQPTFIIDYPKSISPLSKASPENPQIAERFELFINGMECANGFSELNDPAEQYERFLDQGKAREGGDDEAMVLDEDYIRALSYGMPPAAGIGIGIDRLVMLLTNRHSIRDVILFPHMRPEKKTPEESEANVSGDSKITK